MLICFFGFNAFSQNDNFSLENKISNLDTTSTYLNKYNKYELVEVQSIVKKRYH